MLRLQRLDLSRVLLSLLPLLFRMGLLHIFTVLLDQLLDAFILLLTHLVQLLSVFVLLLRQLRLRLVCVGRLRLRKIKEPVNDVICQPCCSLTHIQLIRIVFNRCQAIQNFLDVIQLVRLRHVLCFIEETGIAFSKLLICHIHGQTVIGDLDPSHVCLAEVVDALISDQVMVVFLVDADASCAERFTQIAVLNRQIVIYFCGVLEHIHSDIIRFPEYIIPNRGISVLAVCHVGKQIVQSRSHFRRVCIAAVVLQKRLCEAVKTALVSLHHFRGLELLFQPVHRLTQPLILTHQSFGFFKLEADVRVRSRVSVRNSLDSIDFS